MMHEHSLIERIDAAIVNRQRFVVIFPRDGIDPGSRDLEWSPPREPIARPMHGRRPCTTLPHPLTAPIVLGRYGHRMVDLSKFIGVDP